VPAKAEAFQKNPGSSALDLSSDLSPPHLRPVASETPAAVNLYYTAFNSVKYQQTSYSNP